MAESTDKDEINGFGARLCRVQNEYSPYPSTQEYNVESLAPKNNGTLIYQFRDLSQQCLKQLHTTHATEPKFDRPSAILNGF